jgi:hypothetical protein
MRRPASGPRSSGRSTIQQSLAYLHLQPFLVQAQVRLPSERAVSEAHNQAADANPPAAPMPSSQQAHTPFCLRGIGGGGHAELFGTTGEPPCACRSRSGPLVLSSRFASSLQRSLVFQVCLLGMGTSHSMLVPRFEQFCRIDSEGNQTPFHIKVLHFLGVQTETAPKAHKPEPCDIRTPHELVSNRSQKWTKLLLLPRSGCRVSYHPRLAP